MLKSVPSKLGGAFFMVASMLILLIMPWADKVGFVMEPKFKPGFMLIFLAFIIIMFLLGWLGGKPVSDNILPVAQLCTALYFFYFIVIIPLYSLIEFIIARSTAKKFFVYTALLAAIIGGPDKKHYAGPTGHKPANRPASLDFGAPELAPHFLFNLFARCVSSILSGSVPVVDKTGKIITGIADTAG
jgi:hypothetical protein